MSNGKMGDVNFTASSTNKGNKSYTTLNAELEQWGYDSNGERFIQYDSDREAARQYFLNHVNSNTQHFESLDEKLTYLVNEGYYEPEFLAKYDKEDIKDLFQLIYGVKFRFETFMGAYKFYSSYALKTFDGQRYLERVEDRFCIVALYLADGDIEQARKLALELINGRFVAATPTLLNSGRAARGELVSCFLLNVSDDLNGIMRSVNSAAQLSKRGGGVALNLTNVRATGDPIKKIENQASGVLPIMKILEDTFSYANQLGARQGAGAVYLNAHHLDIEEFLDSKRENADEKIRIKTLSLGVVIPDITFELARKGEKMYLFSPYDLEQVYGKEMSWLNISDIYREAVENPNIRKRAIDPREFLSNIAEVQMESGYPYLMFEDAANRANNVSNIGPVKMSNLCVEILQPQTPSVINDDQTYEVLGRDISCNLGSLNVAKAWDSPDFGGMIETAVRALTEVTDRTNIEAVPTVANGNRKSHSIGLGTMNLHGWFTKNQMYYGDKESLDATNVFYHLMLFHTLTASNKIATERKETFDGFVGSDYQTGKFFEKFTNPENAHLYSVKTEKVQKMLDEAGHTVPTTADWVALAERVTNGGGLYHSHFMAMAPTGSISYVNWATPSVLPITSVIERRQEGKIGLCYVPAPYAEGNEEYYAGHNMYDIDNTIVIDVMSVIQYYTDQSLSLTLGYDSTASTRDVNKSMLYAFSKGKPSSKAPTERTRLLENFPQAEIKTLYYSRVRNNMLEDMANECVSCAL